MQTTHDLIVRWTAYAVASLLLALLDTLLWRDVLVLGVHLFLPPLLVGTVASMEETRAAVIYGTACGVLCDLCLPGVFPCVYTLSFTLASLFASLLAKSALQEGLLRSVAVSLLSFAFLDAFNMAALAHAASLRDMLDVALRESFASCLLLLVCHPVLLWVHRKYTL